MIQNSNNQRLRNGGMARVGMDYYFDDYNTLTFAARIRPSAGGNNSNIVYDYKDSARVTSNYDTRNTVGNQNRFNMTYNLIYSKVFKQKEKEGELILQQLSPTDVLVLLDEKGQEFRSIQFSKFLQKKMNSGIKQLVLVIGGPYGFSDAVYQKAQGKIALSKMTFSHQMIRLFVVEQLYRAFTILKNEPYHHE